MMDDDTNLHVLIVDDEQYVRDHLRELLSGRSAVETLSEATHGREAIQAVEAENPDLVFLDVKMPTTSGTEVVEEVGPDSMPATVFVTAYDEFAVQAFDLAAVDYLLKPFDEDRFHTAFERASQAVKLEQVEDLASRFQTLIDAGAQGVSLHDDAVQNRADEDESKSSDDYLERLTVEARGQIHVIPVEDIRYITAEDTYIRIHTEESSYLLRKRLYEMEEQLAPTEFVRIHRSTIVRLDCVQRLLQRAAGDYVVQLNDAKTLRVSRSRQEDLIRRLEMGAPS